MMYQILTVLLCLGSFTVSAAAPDAANTISCEFEQGDLVLESFLEACPSFANATSSSRVHTGALGCVINHNGSLYEIRVESFEDTSGKLPVDITFYEYAAQNDLLAMPSYKVHPLPGISFESFDFRHAKLDDGVYFSIILRKVE